MTMKAAQLLGKEKLQVNEINIPEINGNEILLKVKASSICGTDVRMFKNGYDNVDENNPLTLGHEISGVIEKVGANVKKYEKGMSVTVAPNFGCGICDQCVDGNTHLCPDYEAVGINLPGGFAEYMVIPQPAINQGNVTILAEGITFEEAALIEPFSCVLNGQEIAGVYSGDIVLIIGGGPIGLMHAMLAFSKGAYKVILNDRNDHRLKFAKKILPDLIIVKSEELKDVVARETNNKGVDLAIIAASSSSAQEESFNYMGMNGRVLFFSGLPEGQKMVQLDSNILHYKQLRVVGCTRAGLSTYRNAVKLVTSGRVPLGKLITNRYSINEFEEAMDTAVNSKGLKNVITFED